MGWFTRALNVLRPNRVSRDIDREMAFHVAERTDDLLAQGMNSVDATREARRRFGRQSGLRESTRDADVVVWLESLANDLKQGLRVLRASPGFTVVAVFSLALGVGANTAIFSLINAVMLKALPVANAHALVTITSKGFGNELTNPIWEQLRDQQQVFRSVAAFSEAHFNLSDGGEVRKANGSWVSGDYFSTLGVNAVAGRLLTPADDKRGCAGTVVLSYEYWQSAYGGKSTVIGSVIRLDNQPFTIAGVATPGFFGAEVGKSVEIYAPLCAEAVVGRGEILDEKRGWFLHIVGRLQDEQTAVRAERELKPITSGVLASSLPPDAYALEQTDPAKYAFSVVPGVGGLSDLRRQYKSALLALMCVVGIVLFIGCANVANLLLARAAARTREIAVRFALGANRGRVLRQLLTETLLLTSLGAAVGVLFARWSTGLILRLLSNDTNAVTLDVPIDLHVLLFTTAVATVIALMFGLAPAWQATGADPQDAMRRNARGITSGHSKFSIAKILVAGQVALSLILVVGAGLLLGTFRTLSTMELGFKTDNVLLAYTDLSNAGLSGDQLRGETARLAQQLRTIPGVRAVGESEGTPVSGGGRNGGITVAGFVPANPRDGLVYMNYVSGEYFSALRTPLQFGRTFDNHDAVGTPRVAIINETTAKKFFGGNSAVGKQFHMPSRKSEGPAFEVIGVVADSKYGSLREEPRPQIFLARSQEDVESSLNFEIQTTGNIRAVMSAVIAVTQQINSRITVQFRTLDDQVAASLTRERLLATLSAFFGVLALLLAMIGLYGTMSYSVHRRRNEIGVRLALGAARTIVFRLALGEVGVMLIVGLLLGVAGAMGASRFVASFLYGVKPTDAATLVWSSVLLSAVALIAGALPAWRAARLDPMIALRED